jgi:hypothetical protein
MSRPKLTLAALVVLMAACVDRAPFTPPTGDGTRSPAQATEQLARQVAQALKDPTFRSELKAQLDASPHREHKLHFQRWLERDGGRVRAAIAQANGVAPADVAREAAELTELEIYLPVPEQRAAWSGDERVLVATALRDDDAPVAFDPHGRRHLLSPHRPPRTPVIALVPRETDFDHPRRSMEACLIECDDGGGSGGSGATAPVEPGLYMTQAHFVDDFEGWLKGAPEFEVYILGQKGQTDSLTPYQCAGEEAWGPYYFNQDGTDWSGNVLLFSGSQIANYNAAHPNQNFRVLFLEDDDGPCVIKTDKDLLREVLEVIDAAFGGVTAGNDSTGTFKRANAFQRLWAALASLIKSNDEVVGTGVEDDVVGTYYPGYNWIVKGRGNATNGWVNLEMK